MNQQIVNSPADKLLIDRILRGDNRAFSIIIHNTEKLVAQIIFKMIPVAEDRKDLAQDVYLKVFHNLAGFKFKSKLSTWIAQIAYNACSSWNEKKRPSLPGNLSEELDESYADTSFLNPLSQPDTENRIFQKELGQILQNEISVLPPVYQTLIVLYHHESMSYEELAEITGLPLGTVKSYLFRARKMLKENLLSKYKKEAL